MKPTKEYLENKYAEFNKLIFDNLLPTIPVKIGNGKTSLGYLKFNRHKSLFGNVTLNNFAIVISTYYDLSEVEIEDTLIHEMIHYYIYFNNITDTSSHGRYFKEKMQEINEKFGRNISISYRIDRNGNAVPR